MSRSFKKPYITDQQSGRKSKSRASRSVQAKRDANRAVRQKEKLMIREAKKLVSKLATDKISYTKREYRDAAEKVADGKAYRKESCSWNIRDWSFHSPKDKKAYRK